MCLIYFITDDFLLLPVIDEPRSHSVLGVFRNVHVLYVIQGFVHSVIVSCLHYRGGIKYIANLDNEEKKNNVQNGLSCLCISEHL